MKKKSANIFLGKKILIYGLGRTGISSYEFLKKKAEAKKAKKPKPINKKTEKKDEPVE